MMRKKRWGICLSVCLFAVLSADVRAADVRAADVRAESFENYDDKKAKPVTHSFLLCGKVTQIIGGDGKVIWSYNGKTRDGYVLPNGNVILTLVGSKKYSGGAVIEVVRKGNKTVKETLIWKGTQEEVNSAQPVAGGRFVITEAGAKPRLLEVDRQGKIHVEFPLQCQNKKAHMQTRMARKLADGTYLAPHLWDFAVKQYDAKGKVLKVYDTTVKGDPTRKIHTWPFTAIVMPNGRIHANCTHSNRAVQFDKSGKIVWTLTNDDLPGAWLADPCGAQVLPNGNVVISSYAQKNPKLPKLFEVTPDKKVVWVYKHKSTRIHHFQILDTNGVPLAGPPRK